MLSVSFFSARTAMVMASSRTFSSQSSCCSPLQPAKQRKTTPFQIPRRPHLPDPIETDPAAQKFKLSEHPQTIFVIREPSSIPHVTERLSSETHRITNTILNQNDNSSITNQSGLSHPILTTSPETQTDPSLLPLPLRTPIKYSNSITPENIQKIRSMRTHLSITQLSKKFDVPRLSIQMLGVSDQLTRTKINLKHEMRQQRRETRWSVGKITRREEKRSRRSLW